MSTTNNPQGAPAADDHGGIGPPAPEVIARGYEADTYENSTVLSVPLLVLLFFVLAFGTVTIIFSFIAYPKSVNPNAHPGAAGRNKEPLNERLNRLGRGHEVDQPRLEPLKLREGDARGMPKPELSVAAGNSPELHPEDLIPTKERFPSLYAGGDGRLGLDKTMSLDKTGLEHLFPVQKEKDGKPAGTKPPVSQHVPTASNAGRGAEGSQVILPTTPNVPAPGPNTAPPPNTKEPKDKGKDKGGKQ
jgi:hypothetical protein